MTMNRQRESELRGNIELRILEFLKQGLISAIRDPGNMDKSKWLGDPGETWKNPVS